MISAILVGNPNCGKTTIFNALARERQKIGNWPGVTVEKKSGEFISQNESVLLSDLPGIYTFNQRSKHCPLDEQITANAILENNLDVIVNVIDATNFERSLLLTSQLVEIGKPLVLALNMTDLSQRRGISINVKILEQVFNCTVIELNAHKEIGIDKLQDAIVKAYQQNKIPNELDIKFNNNLSIFLDTIKTQINSIVNPALINYYAYRILEGDNLIANAVNPEGQLNLNCEGMDIIAIDARFAAINSLSRKVLFIKKVTQKSTVSNKIDKILLNRFLGLPLFFLIMYGMFFVAMNLGSALQNVTETIGENIFIHGFDKLLIIFSVPEWLRLLIVNGFGSGINTTLNFIPVLFCMYFCLSWFELSGYMTRVAFLLDRFMQVLGLPGKAFLPLIIGFGCNVPAIMATRTLHSKNERFLTILISPFMSCSARLAIYAVFVAAFFPTGGHNIVFLLYVIGIVMAVITGFIFKKALFNAERTPLLLELSSYHAPQIKRLFKDTFYKLKIFIIRAGKIIVPLSVVLAILNLRLENFGVVSVHHESILEYVGKHITFLFAPMGISSDNWPATVGLLTGMMAKEVVIGTLNCLYQDLGATSNVYGIMQQYFAGQIGAFAYLLFVLLYIPCISTIAVIRQEATRKIMWLSVSWSLLIAYSTASIFYQVATFTAHPVTTIYSVSIILILLSLFIAGMYYKGRFWLEDSLSQSYIKNCDKPCAGCG